MTEPKTMWAISSGSYSDYRVTAVCESKEIAEATVAKMNLLEGNSSYDEYGIEELPVLDESIHRVIIHHMNVEIRDAGGTGAERQWNTPVWSFDEEAVEVAWRWIRAPMYNGKAGRLDVWGTDQERVRKVLGDQRAMLMADDAYRARVEMKSTSV